MNNISQGFSEKFKKKKYKDVLIPFIIGLVFIVLSLTPLLDNFNTLFYDFFLTIRPEIQQDERILLLDVDDTAIDNLGAWPWPRNYMAEALISMKEFGARSAVFDIEYNTPSPAGINKNYLEQNVNQNFDEKFTDLSNQVSDLFSAIKEQQISLDDADYFINDLISYANNTKDELYADVQHLAIDNDTYLANAIAFFGHVNTAYRFIEEENQNLSAEDREKITNLITIDLTEESPQTEKYTDILPTLETMIEKGMWSGFVNVEIDADGKKRRIKPVETLNGQHYGQLTFSTILEWLGNPEVILGNRKITLKGAQYEDGIYDVVLPLDAEGTMLINWPHRTFEDSFRHLSVYYLVSYTQLVEGLNSHLIKLENRDAWKLLNTINPVSLITEDKALIDLLLEEALVSNEDIVKQDYIETKQQWFTSVEEFLAQDYNSIIQETIMQLEQGADESQRSLLEEERKNVDLLFNNISEAISTIRINQDLLGNSLKGSLCLIGYTGTGTSDIGANPFEKEYINVGTHASTVNTIFQRNFLKESPEWVSLLLTLILPLLLFFFARKMTPVKQSIVGISSIGVTILISAVLFIFTGIFFQLVAPVIALTLTYVLYSLIRFLRESREKSFLRKAFGTYISSDVINEIIDNPDKLKLGGESRYMTAMFTDVKGFSTISEKLSPEQLVLLLNTYLTGMSDIILDEEGVVDKYEGDAIIAFWGAPTPLENHAYHALASALKMKKVETQLNIEFREKNMSPTNLLSRFGINTGEMVAGNMGTQRKMNYTIMGNSVNLAARLEGVNKMYGTWILTTAQTAKEAGNDFVYRKLDRVRVVGINTPVQLLEVVCFKNELITEKEFLLAEYEKARTLFVQREWGKAQKAFKKVLTINESDGPANLYLKRCKDFIVNPPKLDWDGVFNMTQK